MLTAIKQEPGTSVHIAGTGSMSFSSAKVLKNYSFYKFIFFCLVMVSAADITAVDIAGGSVRLAWLLCPLLFLFLPTSSVATLPLVLAVLLTIQHLLATIFTDAGIKGLVYSLWIPFNYLFFFHASFALVNKIGFNIWGLVLLLGRFQCVFAILLVLGGVHERAQFIYYEPSYMAIGLIPYVFSSIAFSNKKILDFLLILSVLIAGQSANLMLIILASVLIFTVFGRGYRYLIFSILFFAAFVFLVVRITILFPESPNYGLALWFYENGLGMDFLWEILNRAGNRVPRIQAAWEFVQSNAIFGVGPGAYEKFTESFDFDYITGGLQYLDPAGLPPVNILLEIALNAGLSSLVVVIVFFIYAFYFSTKVECKSERFVLVGLLLCIGVVMMIESNYLRSYLWIYFGLVFSRLMVSSKAS